MKKKVIIYGASSLISLELIKLLDKDVSRFFLFCREKNKIENFLTNNNFDIKKFSIFEVDILDIEKNLEHLKQIKSVDGIIWVSGFSGDSNEELKDWWREILPILEHNQTRLLEFGKHKTKKVKLLEKLYD